VVAATHEVELDPPQHARVDGIGKGHLNPMASASCAPSSGNGRKWERA
jgi:hypothetical protein